MTIHAHLPAGTDVAHLDHTTATVTADQLAAWCRAPGTKVTIRPVLDLCAEIRCDGYVPSPTLAEQVDTRDGGTCIFPFCTRRRTDRDHTQPYHDDGPTTSTNLGLLCRAHHRAKTFSAWTYQHLEPGVYLWNSPAGATYTVDRRSWP